MRYAETGYNLEIDLSRRSIERIETDPRLTELHLGGLGTNTKIMWDRVPPEIEPFSPDNLLIFSAGLLCGTVAPGCNRTIVTTISPQTSLMAFSMAGGFWAKELKYAGYDKVIIRGKSPDLVYLWINNDKVEVRDASHFHGKGALETAALIQAELKEPKAEVASIGLAGENRVYFASIELGKSSASRGGCGAIMGDKKVKAIAVRGTKDVNIARPDEFFEICNGVMKKLRDNTDKLTPKKQRGFVDLYSWGAPATLKEDDDSFHYDNFSWGNARYRRKGYWNEEIEKKQVEIKKELRERQVSCYNCPVRCTGAISLPGEQRFFLKCSGYTYVLAAELEGSLGYRIWNVHNEYGMDGYSTPQVCAFALELYENGIFSDDDMAGMPSDKEERFIWLVHKIARREGIGDVLANGIYWAARQIGKGAEAYAQNTIKKNEQLPLKLGMLNPSYFLMYCTGEKLTITQMEGQFPQAPLPTREEREAHVKDWIQVPDEKFKQYFLDWDPRGKNSNPYYPTIEATCEIVDWQERMHYIDDCTGICAGLSSFVMKPPYHIHNIPTLISSATGMDIDKAELWEIITRNRTLLRAFNIRRGMRRKDEKPPKDHWKKRFPELEAKLLDEYYKFKGWDNDGIPTKETLDRLGLDYVSKDFLQRGVHNDNGDTLSNETSADKEKEV
jgi:aldehyde:ferredoxin oxidoreductase